MHKLKNPPSRLASDKALIQGCLRGNERAWFGLADRYTQLIYSEARHNGLSSEDSDDVMETVFTIMLRRLEALQDQTDLFSWVITTTKAELVARKETHIGASPAAQLTDEAHRRAFNATSTELATHLQALFGKHLTALLAGIDNPKTVSRWIRGQTPHPGNLTRLRNAYHIATLLELGESQQTAQSWFMGMNPHLGDRAPALVLADQPDEAPNVLQAARTFLAHG